MRPQTALRLVLRAYPRWFREEFGAELLATLRLQREEHLYRRSPLGGLRYWWDVTRDTLIATFSVRWSRLRERAGHAWWGSEGAGAAWDPDPTRRPGRGGAGMLDALRRDLRMALRGLTRNPGYALVFVITLGLGIGANTAMFSAVNGVLLKPLPHTDGDRLVYMRHTAERSGVENALFSVPEIDDYRQGFAALEELAEFSALNFTLLGYDEPRRVRAGIVTGNYFGVMGLDAARGRVIGPEDDGEIAPAVIVLSDGYWRSVFGADPGVVGRTVEMNGRTATIVGVAEPAPPYPERTDIYVNLAASPHHLDASMNHDRIHRMTEVFARLAPGATLDQARAEADVTTSRIHADFPEAYDAGSGYAVTLTPLKTQLTARARPTLLLLLATAFLVFVIACANLANLTLTRVLRRSHELAIRVSLGGGRAALRRALLVESLVLALAGTALGLLLASVGLDLLVAFASRFTARASEIALDGSVFGFAMLTAIAASAFFTLLPPLPRGDGVAGALTRSGTRTTVGSGGRRAQRALVVAQIATSFVLLIGAGLLLRTVLHLQRVDPGFDTGEILSMDVPANSGGRTPDQLRAHYLAVLDDVRALPGVETASLTSSVPLTGSSGFTTMLQIDVENHEPAPGQPTPRADFRVVSTGYFATMGIELLEGRSFVTTDLDGAQPVVILNESMARAYYGEQSALGRGIAWTDPTMKFLGMAPDFRTVVGVVRDTRDGGVDADVVHAMYTPYRQVTPFYTGSLVVRTRGEAQAVLPSVRAAIRDLDPNQPIVNVATIAELGSEAMAPRRLNATLLSAFAVLALIIAAVGIAGVLAFSVGSRRREFGVRSALGAARHRIWSGVVGEGARLAGLGVVLGAITAVAGARFIAGQLVGVPAIDPWTFAAVGLLLAVVAVAAAGVPAWRAARVSPMEALAAE